MCRYILLLKFTGAGESAVGDSPKRAADFRNRAEKMGAKIEAQYWTVGPYDGLLIFSAPDEKTAAGLALGLGRDANVTTCTMRAFDADEFQDVLGRWGKRWGFDGPVKRRSLPTPERRCPPRSCLVDQIVIPVLVCTP